VFKVIINGYVVGEYADHESAKSHYDELCYENLHGDNWKFNEVKIEGEKVARPKTKNKSNARSRRSVYGRASLRLLQQIQAARGRQIQSQ
jgi:hypothetical protein